MPRVRPFAALALVLVALVALVGCVGQNPNPQNAYLVNSQGAVSAGARSALDGTTAPGRQEIIGVYLPFPGTGLAVKAGVEWDGTPRVVEVPMAAPSSPQTVTTQRTVMVPETRTVLVPRTVEERSVVLPVPQAAPNPCAPPVPAPQRVCPEPPPAPPQACAPGSACDVPQTTVASTGR